MLFMSEARIICTMDVLGRVMFITKTPCQSRGFRGGCCRRKSYVYYEWHSFTETHTRVVTTMRMWQREGKNDKEINGTYTY